MTDRSGKRYSGGSIIISKLVSRTRGETRGTWEREEGRQRDTGAEGRQIQRDTGVGGYRQRVTNAGKEGGKKIKLNNRCVCSE